MLGPGEQTPVNIVYQKAQGMRKETNQAWPDSQATKRESGGPSSPKFNLLGEYTDFFVGLRSAAAINEQSSYNNLMGINLQVP